VLLLGVLLAPRQILAQEVPELQITSSYYIVLDAETGEIFAQRGAHERAAPASITKVFTAIEAIELGSPSETITTSEADLVSEFASQVGFGPGETFTVEELLYGMMLPSGNDAARALARGLGAQPGDSEEEAVNRFLDRIHQRLANMGLTDTHLVNPDGWGVPGHHSSAYDIAVFTMYALKYPRFVQTFSTQTYETADGSYLFQNNNRMLRTYDGIIGGKTGYDDDAGWCLVNVAQRDGSTMIAVTLDGVAPDDWYDDNRVLLDYAFEEKARHQSEGLGVIGEIARYRDPDAATILAMASAGGEIGPPLAEEVAAAPEGPRMAAVLSQPSPLATRAAVGTAGMWTAAGVVTVLILFQGAATWRLHRSNPGIRGSHAPRTAVKMTPEYVSAD
jgi:D-alanyl-D-alanine carboxypeptidase